MYVGQLCSRNVATVRTGDEVATAARIMRERHVGYLVVVESDRERGGEIPVGVLTDRDIVVEIVARKVDPRALTVGDIMTSHPVLASEQGSVGMAVQEMRRIGVRRLPVVGKHGELTGVVSLDDVLDATTGELRDLSLAVRNEQRIERRLRS